MTEKQKSTAIHHVGHEATIKTGLRGETSACSLKSDCCRTETIPHSPVLEQKTSHCCAKRREPMSGCDIRVFQRQ